MSDPNQNNRDRLANLSPEQKALLTLRLKQKRAQREKKPRIPRRAASGSAPLSFAQQRLWFLDQLEPGNAFYNMPAAVQLLGPLDVVALEQSLGSIIQRHDVLRSTFCTVNGEPVQSITPVGEGVEYRLPLVDVRYLPTNERATKVQQLAIEEAQQPFDLASGPLIRTRLLKVDEQEHVLLLTMHHIVSDGWSIRVLVEEFAASYTTMVMQQPVVLPELPIQYADFAQWHRDWLQAPEDAQGTSPLQRQLAYWKQQLDGIPPLIELPIDYPRPRVQTFRGAHYRFPLASDVIEALKAMSKREDATLFMTLLAAFNVLLYRYTGQDDICVGTPIANRTESELENLIGFFVNSLVMRTDLSDAPGFRALLQRVRSTALGAYAHQDLPFEMLVEALHPDRTMGYNPIFQVMFSLEPPLLQGLNLAGVTVNQVSTETSTAKFDLLLDIEERPDGAPGDTIATLEYNTDLFAEATIMRMAEHFQTLLRGIVADPDQPISRLPLLSECERQQLVVEWNATAADFPLEQCVHHRFEAQVERTPDAIALVMPASSGGAAAHLTYRELNERANQLAHHLRSLGVGPETLVGICMERSLDLIIGLFAILKAGGAYVPLSPTYPLERMTSIIQDAQISVLLTHSTITHAPWMTDTAPDALCSVISLDTDWTAIADSPTTNPTPPVRPDNLAYVIYTSGSTGQPKGVAVHHRAVVNHNIAVTEQFGVRPDDYVLQFATATFDAAVEEIFPTLACGALLVLRPDELLPTALELIQMVETHQITILDLPTAYWHEWVNEMLRTAVTLPDSLRLVVVGGEAASAERLGDWLRLGGSRITWMNTYGPTEATVIATLYAVTPGTSLESIRSPVTIGRPIANTQTYILDSALQPVPVGVTGELHIGGAGVARGYLNRPELTSERFIPDPFSADPGARLYKTGDLVRYRADGTIEFVGRRDNQVKVRGFRVELGEIETLLIHDPMVQDVVVVAREDVPGDKRLVAYLVPVPDQSSLDTGELRRRLNTQLPDYMVPSTFVVLDALPLTPNGKVDRRALPPPDETHQGRDRAASAPRTPVEEIIAGLWQQVLKANQVSRDDNFFALGGHSLLAAQLIARMREVFQVTIPLRVIFEAPTLADQAREVERCQSFGSGIAMQPITPAPRDGVIPLSLTQQRLWVLDQLESGTPLYHIAGAMRLSGPLDVAVLECSLNTMVQCHEILRTSIVTIDGQPQQVIPPTATLPLPLIDLRLLPEDERQSQIQQHITSEAQQPFDLARGPLVRARLLKVGESEHIALFTMHHIISDGWSMSIFVKELATLYDALLNDQAVCLPTLPIQYADFALWQRQWLQGAMLANQLDYWKQHLAGAPPLLELPTDRPRPAVQTFQGASQTFTIPAELTSQIKQLSHQTGSTLFMTLLAAFQVLLYRYSGQEDICIGTPIANRSHTELEALIGFFVNTLVLRTNLADAPGFRELLKRVRDVALGAYAHQDAPFEMVVDAVQPERNLSHAPLFQVMFIIQNTPDTVLELSNLTVQQIAADTGIATCDIILALEERDDTLHGTLDYNTNLFDSTTITRMISHFQQLLEGITTDPDQTITTLPLLTEAERQQLLGTWNATTAPFPDNHCIQHLFEAQVERTPDALAVAFAGQQLTYRDLNQRANQLAHFLQQQGVQPETLVGICVERSLTMIIGLLGILKAGGAYLPLDSTYPVERLGFMLDDTQVPLLLTQQTLLEHTPHLTALTRRNGTHHMPRIIALDSDWETIARQPTTNPTSSATADNLAYIIYTSGSTGQPKGTLLQHRGLCNLTQVLIEQFDIRAESRVLQFAAFGFDASVSEMCMALLAGATLVLAQREALTSPDDLLPLLRDERITTITLPPSLLAVLPADNLPDLHTVASAGESCSWDIAERWLPGRRFLNGYGPTEATVAASYYQVHQIHRTSQTVPIGRPITNVQLYMLDQWLQPVPIGVPGELHIGGVSLARGYLHRPELTSEKFIPHPFSDVPGARLYKTGDLVRYLPDGTIEFLGRIDHQVKIRGFRVELGEIEAALRQHPSVQDTVVLALADDTSVKRLVAYIVPSAGEEPPASTDLRGFLQTRLPEYMVPAVFMALEAFPLTPNGKVDRKALPAPDAQRRDLETTYTPTRTTTETVLAEIWSQILGVNQIGIHDNFFELGGDSILSIQVIARANQAGLQLTPRQLFQYPTIAELAAVAVTARAVSAEQGMVTGPLPLTPIQCWFVAQQFVEPHHWNQAVLLDVRQPLEQTPLETAVRHLLMHHDALRLRFICRDTGWEQENTGETADTPVTWIDLSALPTAEHQAAIEAGAAEVQASLHLSEGPLVRFVVFDLGTGRPGRLLIVIHHLAVDGVSWRILLEDLQTAYQQAAQGVEVQLPAKTTSFQYWAQRLVEYAHSETVLQEMEYWMSVAQHTTARIPVDVPGSANTEASADTVRVALNAEETRALLQDVPAAYGTEINEVLLTALAQTLAHWTGARATLIALEGHGREDLFDDVDIARTIGWFTTMFPVSLDLGNVAEPGEQLKAMKEHLRRIPGRGIGYGLLRYLNDDPAVAESLQTVPQAEISFNYLGQFDQLVDSAALFALSSESAGPEHSPRAQRPYLLEIGGRITGSELAMEWDYSTHIHHRATIERVAHDFVDALRALIRHCQSADAGGYTPSDFQDVELSQDEINALMSEMSIDQVMIHE